MARAAEAILIATPRRKLRLCSPHAFVASARSTISSLHSHTGRIRVLVQNSCLNLFASHVPDLCGPVYATLLRRYCTYDSTLFSLSLTFGAHRSMAAFSRAAPNRCSRCVCVPAANGCGRRRDEAAATAPTSSRRGEIFAFASAAIAVTTTTA